jgi:hypothetical protein
MNKKMKIFLISYRLNPCKNYDSLFVKLKSFSRWWHYLETTWIVISDNTNDDVSTLTNNLTCEIDRSTDNILILEVGDMKSVNGWLPKEAWDWIKDVQKLRSPLN